MKRLVPKRRAHGRRSGCTHVTPRAKPIELRVWIVRELRSWPPEARPDRAELYDLLGDFHLSEVERNQLVDELEQELSGSEGKHTLTHFSDLYKSRSPSKRAA
jgi:hypothetical protein